MKHIIWALGWVFLDQISKLYIEKTLYLGESRPIIENIFHITYIINHGAAFGILADQRWFFLFVAALLWLGYGVFRKRIPKRLDVELAVSLLLGGALGNAIDRFWLHGVRDFFDFRIWPIFNIADIEIMAGVFILIWYIWDIERERKRDE